MITGLNSCKLEVKLLSLHAKSPTVAHPGEDLGYDLYAAEDSIIFPDKENDAKVYRVRTEIAVAAYAGDPSVPVGLLIRDRSSLASQGVFTHGGVIDAGYRGEIIVLMTAHIHPYRIREGDKIAQMIPVPVLTGQVVEVGWLNEAARGERGFGSSGV